MSEPMSISEDQLKAVLNILLDEVQDRVSVIGTTPAGDPVTAILISLEITKLRQEIAENSFLE